jgi:hypothetical protein
MNTNSTRRFARYIALPIVSAGIIGGAALGMAGIIGGAALGMAGMANAATSGVSDPQPGIVATPHVKAHPAPNAVPGWHGHHGVWRIRNFESGYRS